MIDQRFLIHKLSNIGQSKNSRENFIFPGFFSCIEVEYIKPGMGDKIKLFVVKSEKKLTKLIDKHCDLGVFWLPDFNGWPERPILRWLWLRR